MIQRVGSSAEARLATSLDGTITTCNESSASLFGYSANDLVGRSVSHVLPALSPDGEHVVAQRLRRGEPTLGLRLLGRTRDGHSLELRVDVAPAFDPNGALAGATLTVCSLDPDEIANEARARLAAIVDSSDDAIIGESLEGIILSWNAGAERLYGYRADEVIGRSMDLLVPPERRRAEAEVLERALRGESTPPFETERILENGERLPTSVSVSPIRDSSGAIIGLSRIARDISARVRGDEARARLAALVEGSTDAIVSKPVDGIITTWNPAAERMFGFTPEEAIGQPILLIIPPERRAEEAAVLAAIRRGEIVEHFETVRMHKSGAPVHVSLTVSPIRDAAGHIIGASKIARDIGDRLRFQAERERLLREAQASNRAKDQFLAMLGHELRNPLGALMAALQVIEERGPSDPSIARASEIGARQVRTLAKLVDDLLDIGRVVTGKIAIHLEPLDLAEVVRTHVAALRAAGRLDSHHLVLEASGEAMICADTARLEQIVANVVGNALRYTPPGGHIRVRVERTREEVTLTVEDDGVGIAPENLPHIFDLFVQSELRPERSRGGLGVGLTLVRRLMELQDGRVEAFSEGVGKGSRFVLHFPPLVHAFAVPPRQPPSRSERHRRVLVIEDDEDTREMLRLLLQMEGHEVEEAADGRAGVQAALRHRPEVALIDVGLPELDGYEVAREIRARTGDEMFLVALTGYGSESDRRRAMHAGFDHHMRKPVALDALKELLAEPLPNDHAGAP